MIYFSKQDMINLLNDVDDDVALRALNKSKTVEALVESVNTFGAALDQICEVADEVIISDFIKAILVSKANDFYSKHPIIANMGTKELYEFAVKESD